MLKRLDDKHVQGEFLNFRDEGGVYPGSLTHKFAVTSRVSGALLGFVRWFPHWRGYCFHALNSIFDKKCLRELADFCAVVTDEHRTKTKVL